MKEERFLTCLFLLNELWFRQNSLSIVCFFRHNIFYIEKQKIYFTTYLIENLLTLLNIRITYRKDFAKYRL